MKRFEVFLLTSLRRSLKIKWFFHVLNEEVLRRAGIKSIETFISAARLRWYGHVARIPEERPPKFLLNWRPNYGKRSRWRPRKTGGPVYWRMRLTLQVSTTSTWVLYKLYSSCRWSTMEAHVTTPMKCEQCRPLQRLEGDLFMCHVFM